jgi:chorismate synthase
VLERASARETAARVAAAAIARQLLACFDVQIVSHVYSVNGVGYDSPLHVTFEDAQRIGPESALRCADPEAETRMIAEIDRCRDAGDTAGGAFEVIVRGLPVGLGSYVQWDRKLDGRLAQAMMSIPAIKAVGIGIGPNAANVPGSRMHDEILPAPTRTKPPIGVSRPTNNAGGLEGGVTNGEDLRISGFMKPIATLMKPLRSVDLTEMTESPATIERSDVCAISAAAVVGEAVVGLVLADAFLEKFSGDSLGEIRRNYTAATDHLQSRFHARRP